MSGRTLTGLGIACVAALVSLTACTSGNADANHSKDPTKASSGQSPETVTASPSASQPSVQTPPELDADETLAGRHKATTGNSSLQFRKGKKGDALIIAVRCQGSGKIKVALRPVHVSFPLECLANEVTTTYTQAAVPGVARTGVVAV